MNPKELQLDPYVQAALNQGKKPTVKGRGGPLTAFISEAGGAGGAAAGAAYGAAAGSILPGAGTLLGAIIGGGIGGLAGGFGGKAVEQKIRDDQNVLGTGGSFKEAVKEGLLSGAFGAGGQAFSGLRAAKVAGIGAKEALSMAPKSLQLAKELTKETSKALSGATRELSRAYGTSINAKVGQVTLSPQDARILTNHISSISKAINPEQVSADLSNYIDDLGKQIGQLVADNNFTLTRSQALAIKASAKDAIKNVGGGPEVTRYLADIGKKRSLADIQALTQSIGDQVNWAKFSGSTSVTPQSQQALSKIYDTLRSYVNTNVKGLDSLNKQFALSKQALPFVEQTVRQGGINAPVVGLGGRLGLKGRTAVAARAGLAKTGQAIGRATGAAGILPQQAGLQTIKGVGGLIGGGTAQPTTLEDALTQSNITPQGMGLSSQQLSAYTTPQETSPYTRAGLMADIQRDPKNAAKYVDMYSSLAKIYAPSSTSQVGKVTAQQFGLAQSGMQSLQNLANLISQNPSVVSKTATPGRKLPIVGGYISQAAGTGEYDALAFNVADALLRLRTGAQANESEIRNVQSQLMPRAGDSEATIQRKLNTLYDVFNSVAAQAGQQGGTTLEDLLMQGGAQ